ncbi:hypothetical protein BpHYR1_024742 [Brachionus plicatilis]|uniref:Uncharacterized protein n=1 Tax=Brachionus plicatilis TaxID=10195 RepID=A0A3M7P9Z9_BRAPC|nr:hypothetical protein BpHYR1_024742 [Brachionus plicatilis]
MFHAAKSLIHFKFHYSLSLNPDLTLNWLYIIECHLDNSIDSKIKNNSFNQNLPQHNNNIRNLNFVNSALRPLYFTNKKIVF